MNSNAFTHENLKEFSADPVRTIMLVNLVCEGYETGDAEQRQDARAALNAAILKALKHLQICDNPTCPVFPLFALILALGVFEGRKEIGRG